MVFIVYVFQMIFSDDPGPSKKPPSKKAQPVSVRRATQFIDAVDSSENDENVDGE